MLHFSTELDNTIRYLFQEFDYSQSVRAIAVVVVVDAHDKLTGCHEVVTSAPEVPHLKCGNGHGQKFKFK